MIINTKVLAVVVTYNRSLLLKRCIEKILSQTSPPEDIVVINNGSTDNTLDILKEMNIKVITQDNKGSAGGWLKGIEYSLENNFDAAWLMDDDGYPERDSLEKLKKSLNKNISCVSSIVIKEDNKDCFVFPYPIINKNNKPAIFSWPRKLHRKNQLINKSKSKLYPFAHLFNGSLISTTAIKQVGNIDINYFIYGDELDYFFRLRNAGEVFSVTDALHFHPDVTKRKYNFLKIYYLLKNTLILNKKYYDYVFLRQISQIINILIIVLKRNGIIFFIKLLTGKNKTLIPRAIIRGIRGEIGHDFYK